MLISHYTTYDVLINHVIPSRKLRFSSLSRLNDPHERQKRASRLFTTSDDTEDDVRILSEARRVRENGIKVFCSSAFDDDDSVFNCKSSHISPMWAHYSRIFDNENINRGCVLIIDEGKLISAISSQIKNGFVEYVPYGVPIPGVVSEFLGNPTKEEIISTICEGAEKVWFKKSDQWKYECEYRILIYDETLDYYYFNILDSIVGIAVDCISFNALSDSKRDIMQSMGVPLICTYYRPEVCAYKTNKYPAIGIQQHKLEIDK
jgi:hypothetical protein